MSRILLAAILAVAIGSVGPAWAQTQSTAPTTDAGTKLNFPATLGGSSFERVVNYAAPPANRPDLGSSYFYSTPKKMVITVQVFDAGRRVPAGSASPIVIGEFGTELDSVAQQIQGSGYTNFQRPPVPSTCTYGAVTFRCITYSAVSQANMRVYCKLLLTGYQNHFIKIRIEWGQSSQLQQTSAEADEALQAFIPALFH
ncbi:MAG TPA: hypothetical protein VGO42_03015 [Reyranella sp.]|nr:hypothetical protein [Reyranella sp.]